MDIGLYIVPTPIGNLDDMTYRAVEVLKSVDLILAEDTRVSQTLLRHYGIENMIKSFHQHNEHRLLDAIIDRLESGQVIALISDAGTPGISDPGFLLSRACRERKIGVSCLPGPTAVIPALINSGLPADKFVFEGFLPHKKGRHSRLELLQEESRTLILYESPHRLHKTLVQLCEYFGEERLASVSREISKKFEETLHGSLKELATLFEITAPRGEFVIVIQGKS